MNIIKTDLRFRNSLPNNNAPKELILHHLEANGWSVERVHKLHRDEFGWSGIGYHYYIRKDGTIYKGRPDYTQGAHCKGANRNSLGIAFEGMYNSVDKVMPNAQYNAGNELIAYLKKMYGDLPIYGHRERGSSDCPGQYFPLDAFRTGNYSSVSSAAPTEAANKPSVTGKKALITRLQSEINKQGFGNVSVDGLSGPRTLGAAPLCRPGARGNITQIIQEMLINMGYGNYLKPWGADGVYGKGTESAIRQFQKNYGLSSDGIVGRNTWSKFFEKLN